jgi:hypothetical protein
VSSRQITLQHTEFPDRIQSVVFVHGLCGHPRNTWTKDNVCWPEDLLSKEDSLSHIRILTFGYDVNLNDSSSLNSLFDHSINLLNELSRVRRQDAVSLVSFSGMHTL